MQFSKWHGAGNDFVIVNGFKEKVAGLDLAAAGRKVCDRHFGVGADGLVFILPSDTADFRMQIINSDGSEAEMCGNVTRCVARYVYEQGMTDKTKVTLETLAGPIRPELVFADGKVSGVRVDMGKPRFKRGGDPDERSRRRRGDKRAGDGRRPHLLRHRREYGQSPFRDFPR